MQTEMFSEPSWNCSRMKSCGVLESVTVLQNVPRLNATILLLTLSHQWAAFVSNSWWQSWLILRHLGVRLTAWAIRRLCVTLLHPTQRFELFGNILHHLIAISTKLFVLEPDFDVFVEMQQNKNVKNTCCSLAQSHTSEYLYIITKQAIDAIKAMVHTVNIKKFKEESCQKHWQNLITLAKVRANGRNCLSGRSRRRTPSGSRTNKVV